MPPTGLRGDHVARDEATMNKLTKQQQADLDKLVESSQEAHKALTEGIDAFNEALEAARAKLTESIEKYNATVEQANEFMTAIHDDMDSYYSDKSERWQEGDAGNAYQEWMEPWGTEIDPLEIDLPDDIEHPEDVLTETLNDLPREKSA
jgi:uncharacterized protein YukE